MKSIGIQRASQRLGEATKHLERLGELSKGLDVPAFEYEWFLAISAINSAHEILKTTAGKAPASKQWFASIEKHTIRKDPLLRYVLHARGADHHGLMTGAAPKVSGAKYLGYGYPQISFTTTDKEGNKQVITGGAIMLEGNVSSFKFEYQLVDVTDDRDGTVYAVPDIFLGEPVTDATPMDVGQKAVAYYADLLRIASSSPALTGG